MNIEIKSSYYGTELIVEDTNVKLEESISSTIYAKKEDGKTDFKKRLGNDIDDEWMAKMCQLTEDTAYYRQKEYDSTQLIEILFEKLPENIQEELAVKLHNDYVPEL